ncbi:CIC11C00000000114 [Sungouiella intermedia]|uniref:CIC11C00000000114 n=1 Tax=Sungouiella intermedia TaxID=45354 RepID=A0A1L0BLJ0_9ASCO|nr:CIC11C00000000114 [[Candida] intermedia]
MFLKKLMSKRSHSELDNDEYQDEQTPFEQVNNDDRLIDSSVLLSLLRLVLTRHARNQRIRKDHLAPILHRHNLKGNIITWFNSLKKEFEDLFGITLIMSGNEIFLLNNLQLSSREALDGLLKREDVGINQADSNFNDLLYHMSNHKRKDVIVNTSETIMSGIVILIISVIVVNENRIRETNLLEVLDGFGLSENLSSIVANINKNTQDILSELVRREYIGKLVTGADQNSQVDYCLGKAALRDIEPKSILRFLQGLFHHEDMHLKCYKTVQRCFPEASLSEPVARD